MTVDKVYVKVPWFLVLGLILLANVALNVALSLSVVANAITQVLFYFMLGYMFLRNDAWAKARSFHMFLMACMFSLSTLVVWFSLAAQVLFAWLFLMVQLVFVVIIILAKPVKFFGTGQTWFYASVFVLLIMALAGTFVSALHLGFSQILLWNLAVSCTGISYVLSKAQGGKKKTYIGILFVLMQTIGLALAVTAAFGFQGIALSLIPS